MLSLAQALGKCFIFFTWAYRFVFADLKCLNLRQVSLSLACKRFEACENRERFLFLFWSLCHLIGPQDLFCLRSTQSHRKHHESRQSDRGVIKTLKTSTHFTFYSSKIPFSLAMACFAWNQPGLHSDYRSQRISKYLLLCKRVSLLSAWFI